MKKILLGTSAVALVGAMTTASNAAEWDIGLGGYMEQSINYINNDTSGAADFSGVHSMSDQEFYVTPSITLDNGIKVSVQMQFEGANTGGVDEPLLRVSGSFGTLTMGEDDDAANDTVVTAPEVDFIGIVSGSDTNFYASTVVGGPNATGPFTNLCGDCMKIKYFTPRIAGFQIGASYARDQQLSGAKGITDIEAGGAGGVQNNTFSVGANYSNSFGGVDVALGGGYTIQDVSDSSVAGAAATNDPTGWNAGLSIGVAGFTIGGGYARNDDIEAIAGGRSDNTNYAVGVAYETGPWGVSATWQHSESDDPVVTNDDEMDAYKIAASYKLAKGVTVAAWGIYMDGDDAATTADFGSAAAGGGGDITTFVIGTGIKASF